MKLDERFCTQVNNGLAETAACASAPVYDRANGLIFLSYMTGLLKRYGESTGKLCLSVFPPAQPSNIRFRVLDEGVGQSRGLLCTAHYLIGDGKTRVMFTTTRGEKAAYLRDYDFFADEISPRREVLFRTDSGDVRLDSASYRDYIRSRGFEADCEAEPIINKVTSFEGELYTAITLDGPSYPVLCRIADNVLVPFAVCPEATTYEFRYFRNQDGIFGAFRVPPDNHLTGHGGYTCSRDGGVTWETKIYEDGIQSRPDILEYEGKPLLIYNFRAEDPIENWPHMHNFRNAVKLIYDGKEIASYFSKYGIVEHQSVSLCGDLYMAFSNCPQALSTENGTAWIEDGIPVEQGKEAIQWLKLGYLL